MTTGNPNQFNQMNQGILIKKPFDQKEARRIIDKFYSADMIKKGINSMLQNEGWELPVPICILAQPDFVFAGWLQDITVHNSETCAMLTFSKEIAAPLYFCFYPSILYMRTRLQEFDSESEQIILVDNMLKAFEADKI
jgi:hypothetical protein